MKGFLLALQFFTIIPIHKELPMTKKSITAMFISLPIVGLLIGSLATGVYVILQHYTDVSPLFIAFLIVLTSVILTGGLHLDGLIDMGDAYFSYRSIDKRHEILDDPRVGAFGVMSVLFLILAKIFVINEVISNPSFSSFSLVLIPLLARAGMGLYLVQTPASKETGLGAFFKSHIHLPSFLVAMITLMIGAIIGFGAYQSDFIIPLLFVGVTICATWIYRYWTLKNFRGSSGDLYGAFIEGMELILWIVLLLSL